MFSICSSQMAILINFSFLQTDPTVHGTLCLYTGRLGSKMINLAMLFSVREGCRLRLCTSVKPNYRTSSAHTQAQSPSPEMPGNPTVATDWIKPPPEARGAAAAIAFITQLARFPSLCNLSSTAPCLVYLCGLHIQLAAAVILVILLPGLSTLSSSGYILCVAQLQCPQLLFTLVSPFSM